MGGRLTSRLIFISTLLTLAAGGCTKFDFNANDTDPNTGYRNPYLMASKPAFMVTPYINCTAELAQGQPELNNTTPSCGFDRYAMGLTLQPRLQTRTYPSGHVVQTLDLDISAATKASLIALVQGSNLPNASSADWNATTVVNYTTVGYTNFPLGFHGFWEVQLGLVCWNGTLSGCDGENANGTALEGARIQACAPQWLDDKQSVLPPGQQQYLNVSQFVYVRDEYTPSAFVEEGPLPTYDEAKGNATVVQMQMHNDTATPTGGDSSGGGGGGGGDGDDKSGAWSNGVSFANFVVLGMCAVISNYL
ncbi:hypothetical protein F4777DRAFT_582177 [Nemania sp. FL0916]|nr:hypothetical protein F4777DRAFT_582177 [Nemania sp. FL0916]